MGLTMKMEATVSRKEAQAAANVLHEYLAQGGAIRGVELRDVQAFLDALCFADRIVIAQEEG